ncbi:hypothetical protein [Desulfitobacterium hafniense]|nr:hypothetical protein [Desulfitobacterium hafniense]
MSIRVFAKKAFEFSNGEVDAKGVRVTAKTRPLDFAELPDWAEKDPLFGWAQADGDLEVISGAKKPRGNQKPKEPEQPKEEQEPPKE